MTDLSDRTLLDLTIALPDRILPALIIALPDQTLPNHITAHTLVDLMSAIPEPRTALPNHTLDNCM